MILELASLLGTSVGGKLFGLASEAISYNKQMKREDAEMKHLQSLADKKQLVEYMNELNEPDSHHGYSPLAWVVSFCIGLFAVTYCYAALTCFTDNPTQLLLTKDPAEDANTFSILFGFIEWDFANNKVIQLSKAGLGYLMLHPIVFILSMVSTGDRPKKGR